MDNPAMEIWASLAMFKLKSLNLKFPPHFKAWVGPTEMATLLLLPTSLATTWRDNWWLLIIKAVRSTPAPE